MTNKVVKNTVANIVSKVWAVISLYLFVPIWISYVGVDGYGIIAFYTVLMVLLHFADAGLSAMLTREFAREDRNEEYKSDLLYTTERFYYIIAFFLFVFLFVFSEWIVDFFLKSPNIPKQDLIYDMRLMSVIVAFNFLYMLYNGGLIGKQMMVLSNAISISYSFSRSVIVIVFLYFWPSVETFLYWQLVSIIVTLFIARYSLIHSMNINSECHYRLDYVKNQLGFSLGMMMMAIISALNSQMDKLVTGHVLSLESLGYYSLASSIGSAVLIMVQPLGSAFYPELTRRLSSKDSNYKDFFLIFTYIVSMLSSIVGFLLLFNINDITYLWTHDWNIVNRV